MLRDLYSIKRDLYSIKRDLSYCCHSITPRHVILSLYSVLKKNETCPIVKRPIFYQKRPIILSSLNNTKACHIFTLFYSIRTRHVILLRDLYSIKRDLLYCYHSITMRYVILLLYSITTRHVVLLLFNNVMSCRYLRSRMTWAMSHCYYS